MGGGGAATAVAAAAAAAVAAAAALLHTARWVAVVEAAVAAVWQPLSPSPLLRPHMACLPPREAARKLQPLLQKPPPHPPLQYLLHCPQLERLQLQGPLVKGVAWAVVEGGVAPVAVAAALYKARPW